MRQDTQRSRMNKKENKRERERSIDGFEIVCAFRPFVYLPFRIKKKRYRHRQRATFFPTKTT